MKSTDGINSKDRRSISNKFGADVLRSKQMNNTSRIIISSVLVVCVLLSTSAFAAIYHTSAASAESKSIYVAGNPNLYPVEYYDEESGCYMGIMPVILEEISKEIGYDFTYIESGKKDKRFVEHFDKRI